MKGVFQIDRSIFNHAAFKKEPYSEREAFSWMIGEASFKKRKVSTKHGEVVLKRGQLTASGRFMAQKWEWNESKVRRFLAKLTADAQNDAVTDAIISISIQKDQRVITICNYDKYQKMENYKTALDMQNLTQQSTQQKTQTRTKDNNIYAQPFADWWEVYPRKVGKRPAFNAYAVAMKKIDAESLKEKTIFFAQQEKSTDPQYIPHPTTWLNQERWNDEPEKDSMGFQG